LVSRGETAKFVNDVGVCEVPVADVPEGDYDLRAILLGSSNEEIGRAAAVFHKPGPPVWSGNTLGTEDRLLAPWTPLLVDARNNTVECWGRRYTFGTLLDRVRSAGEELLASPVTLEAVIGGKPAALSCGPWGVEKSSPTRARLRGRGEAAGLSFAVQHDLEFDGYTWTELAIRAGMPVHVDELRLTWSMPKGCGAAAGRA